MSADLSIDYSDGREQIWLPVAPQSWLSEHWGPIAIAEGWRWIELIADNTCQVFEADQAHELHNQLVKLREFLGSYDEVNSELRDRMFERLDLMIPPIAEAADQWDSVQMISIG